jgi:phage gp46-like protein
MSDVAIKVLRNGKRFDIAMDELDLMRDDGLYSDVIVSLFSDARANEDDQLPDARSTDRRGFWGDEFSPAQGDRFGSRRWLLGRSKQLNSIVQREQRYAEEALAWLVADGRAESVAVTGVIVRTGVLGLKVVIKPVESTQLEYGFEIAY